jgi:hypothetical protein
MIPRPVSGLASDYIGVARPLPAVVEV